MTNEQAVGVALLSIFRAIVFFLFALNLTIWIIGGPAFWPVLFTIFFGIPLVYRLAVIVFKKR